jgi:hypothetical protein
MKHVALILLLSIPNFIFGQEIRVNLSANTEVTLYSIRPVSSKFLEQHDVIPFAVKEDVFADDGKTLLFEANTIVNADVINAKKAKGAGKQGVIDFNISSVKTTYGDDVQVYLDHHAAGVDRSDHVLAVGWFLFWPALFVKGSEAQIEPGSILKIKTTRNETFRINKKDIRTPLSSEQKERIRKSILGPYLRQIMVNENCGPRPIAPKSFNNPQYKTTKKYKEYRKELRKWSECEEAL